MLKRKVFSPYPAVCTMLVLPNLTHHTSGTLNESVLFRIVGLMEEPLMTSHSDGTQEKHSETSGSKISFRLVPEFSKRLKTAAQGAKVSPNQMARTLLVTALETPSRHELVSDLYEVSTNTECLRQEVRELRQELATLTYAVSAILEIFLLSNLGLSEPEIEVLLSELFTGRGEQQWS